MGILWGFPQVFSIPTAALDFSVIGYTNAYKSSFFKRTDGDWNQLEEGIIITQGKNTNVIY